MFSVNSFRCYNRRIHNKRTLESTRGNTHMWTLDCIAPFQRRHPVFSLAGSLMICESTAELEDVKLDWTIHIDKTQRSSNTGKKSYVSTYLQVRAVIYDLKLSRLHFISMMLWIPWLHWLMELIVNLERKAWSLSVLDGKNLQSDRKYFRNLWWRGRTYHTYTTSVCKGVMSQQRSTSKVSHFRAQSAQSWNVTRPHVVRYIPPTVLDMVLCCWRHAVIGSLSCATNMSAELFQSGTHNKARHSDSHFFRGRIVRQTRDSLNLG